MNGHDPMVRGATVLDRLSDRFRSRRDVRLRLLILKAIDNRPEPGPFRILDLGGRFEYWRRVGLAFLEAHDIHVICLNASVDEMKAHITVSPRLAARIGDARNLSDMADNSFDMVHANSVVEHVGRFADMRAFANEAQRLAPCLYVQTPYFWFPIDPHFPRVPLFHWMPLSWRHRLVRRMRAGWARPARNMDDAMRMVESSVLLDRSQYRALFPDAQHRFEWVLLPKSMIAERAPSASDG
jgi:hypothetical protein